MSSVASAANHYVRAGASGTGTDWTNACGDFTGSCAVSSLVRGDTYYVAAGNYAGRTFNTAVSGTSVITIKRATIADHGINTGWSDAYNGQANWTDSLDFSTSYWVWDGITSPANPLAAGGNISANYGFTVKDASACSTQRTALRTAGNNTFRHFAMPSTCGNGTAGSCQFGALLTGTSANNITFSHFLAENNTTDVQGSSSGGATNLIVEYLYSRGQWSLPVCHGEVAATGGSNAIFRYNYFDQCQGTACIASNGPSMNGYQIYGNVMNNVTNGGTGCGSGGNGAIAGAGADGIFNNALIYNNTIIQPGMCYGWFYDNGGSNNTAYNNIIKGNCSWNGSGTRDYNYYLSCNSGSPPESNGQIGSGNLFVNLAGRDFHLTTETNAAKALPSPYNIDIDGNPRTSSRGAYQYGGSQQPALAAPQNITVTIR